MQKNLVLIALTLLIAGCTTLEEAYYLDREFGKHSQASLDSQILYPDYRYADRMPEGLAGVTAEEVMNIYNKNFAEKPRRTRIYEFGLGESK